MNTPEQNTDTIVGIKPIIETLKENSETILCVYIQENRTTTQFSTIVALCKQHGIPFKFYTLQSLNRLYNGNHQGAIAKITEIPLFSLEEIATKALQAPLPLLIALDMVQDVGNLGTLARTLYAFGGAGIILTKHGSATPNTTAQKSSAGTLRNLPISIVTNLAQSIKYLTEEGFTAYGTSCTNSENAFSTKYILPAVLILGNEEKGVRPLVQKQCSHTLHIPMQNTCNSINVAQSGAILTAIFAMQQI